MQSKNDLRKEYKLKRRQLDAASREALSAKIKLHFLEYLATHRGIEHIHIFLPINRLNEINTWPLIETLLQQNKSVYTSVSDLKNRDMMTVQLGVDQGLSFDSYGIPVPAAAHATDESLIQVVVIPLLAYDLKGQRLGYGMGFYDKFLSRLSKEVVKAGISFFPPEEKIPSEPHDVPLDFCIQPEGILVFNY